MEAAPAVRGYVTERYISAEAKAMARGDIVRRKSPSTVKSEISPWTSNWTTEAPGLIVIHTALHFAISRKCMSKNVIVLVVVLAFQTKTPSPLNSHSMVVLGPGTG